jgi:cell division protein FtsL
MSSQLLSTEPTSENLRIHDAASLAARKKQQRETNRFIVTWLLAVLATVAAFVVHLSLRGKTVSLGYELGRVRSEQTRLHEMRHVLELEAASYKTPGRVETVARTLLGMEQAPPERIIALRAEVPSPPEPEGDHERRDVASPGGAGTPQSARSHGDSPITGTVITGTQP